MIAVSNGKWRDAVVAILTTSGYKVDEVVWGDQVVDQYTEVRPDCVLMDETWRDTSGRSGFAILSELRKLDSEASVIICVNSSDPSIVTQAFKTGATDVIRKTHDIGQSGLLDAVEEAVGA
jgi:FixJ family two-component response regulator